MGGRGGSGGTGKGTASKAIHVDGDSGFHKEYVQVGKKVYDATDNYKEINRSLAEIEQGAQKAGFEVKKLSKSEVKNLEKQREIERKQTDDLLNQEYARNKQADIVHKAYRNHKKAMRLQRR